MLPPPPPPSRRPHRQATGCGKTHTINGCYTDDDASGGEGSRTLKEKGVIHLTMDHLFALIASKADTLAAQLSFSYLEIYNETIRDLLTEGEGPRNGLALRKDDRNRITVPGLTEVEPRDAVAIHAAVEQGNKRRRTEMTNANQTSSRSHAVLQINVRVRPLEAGLEASVSVATLSIIDLAGSERAAATSNLGARMKEGSSINKSLLSLGNCINALCQPKTPNRHIPYRDSKLTRLLEFSLGGNCKTCMIVCISPSTVHYDDTQNTLKYANRAKQIKTAVSRNAYSVQTHVKQYVQKIAELSATVSLLQRKLEAKAAEEAGQEARRRDAMRLELGRARDDVLAKAAQTKEPMVDGALCEAVLFAAETRLRPLRSRLAELAALANDDDDDDAADRPAAAAAAPLAPALVAERALLARLAEPDEALLGSRALQDRLQAAGKASAILDGVVRAVQERRRTAQLDGLAKEMVDGTCRLATADLEAAQRRAAEDRLRATTREQAERLATLAGVVARSLSAIQDAQGRLDLWSTLGSSTGGDPAAVRTVARALGETARAAGTAVEGLVADAAVGASATGRASPTKTQPYTPSAPSFPFGSGAPRAAAATSSLSSLAAAKSRGRRSLVAGSSSSSSSSALHTSSPVKKASAMKAKSAPSPMRSSAGAASPYRSAYRASTLSGGSGGGGGSAKKLRWRDEAGEGEIDDASRLLIRRTIVEADEEEDEEGEDAEWEDEKADAAPPLPTFGKPTTAAAAALSTSLVSSAPLASAPAGQSSSKGAPPPPPPPNVFKIPMLPKGGPPRLSKAPAFATPSEDIEPNPATTTTTMAAAASSSSSFFASSLAPVPPPSLFSRKPLGDAGPGLNVNSSFSLSSRLSPESSSAFNVSGTKAFSLFAAGPQASPLRQPPVRTQRVVSSPAKRRVSNVGPMRTEKKRTAGRSSLIPVASPPGGGGGGGGTGGGLADLPTFHELTPKTSALGGGARRVLMADAGAGPAALMRSPKKAALPGPAGRAPRASLMGPMGRSRASLAPPGGPVPSYALPTASKTAAVTENLRSRTSIATGGSAAWR